VSGKPCDNADPADASSLSVLDAIGRLKSGLLDPKTLSADDRRACVAYLGSEGLGVAEIAQLMQVSDRTIRRDREAIRDANALEPDPALAGRVAGQLMVEAEACMTRIRRVTWDRDTPPGVRVEGERACFQILGEMTQRLQSLGFLPTSSQQIEASVTVDSAPVLAEIDRELSELITLARREENEGLVAELTELKTQADLEALREGIARLADRSMTSVGDGSAADGSAEDGTATAGPAAAPAREGAGTDADENTDENADENADAQHGVDP